MTEYNFNKAKTDTLNVRVDKNVANGIRSIAKTQETTIQEVCRVFLEQALKDYSNKKKEQ